MHGKGQPQVRGVRASLGGSWLSGVLRRFSAGLGLVCTAASGQALAQERLPFGPLHGMVAAVVSKAGLDTASAVIRVELTDIDLRRHCRQNLEWPSPDCIREYRASTALDSSIEANCVTGQFKNMFGLTLRAVARQTAGGPRHTEVVAPKDGKRLVGTETGLDYNKAQFLALCPSGAVVARPSVPSASKTQTSTRAIAQATFRAPGAIVCADHNTVLLMVDRLRWSNADALQDRLMRGQASLIRGPNAAPPDLAAYGCALVPDGTPMQIEEGNLVPFVNAVLPDGRRVRGVTLIYMMKRDQP